MEEILEKLAEGDKNMLAIKNFGPKSLAELKDRLQAQGFIAVEEVEEAEEIEVCRLIGLRLRSRSQKCRRIVLMDQGRMIHLEGHVRDLG